MGCGRTRFGESVLGLCLTCNRRSWCQPNSGRHSCEASSPLSDITVEHVRNILGHVFMHQDDLGPGGGSVSSCEASIGSFLGFKWPILEIKMTVFCVTTAEENHYFTFTRESRHLDPPETMREVTWDTDRKSATKLTAWSCSLCLADWWARQAGVFRVLPQLISQPINSKNKVILIKSWLECRRLTMTQ